MNWGFGGLVVGCVGLALIAGAGIGYVAQHERRPPPAPQIIRMGPENPAPAPQPPAFGPVPHVTVTQIPRTPPTPAPAAEPAPAVIEKPVVKPKPPARKVTRKTKAQRTFEQRWSNVKR